MILNVNPFRISMVAGVISNKIISVEDLCGGFGSEKKIKRLIRDTGFQKLSIAEPGVCSSDMCYQAAEYILDSANIDRNSIGALIFVSQTPDYMAPSTAFVLQKRLGLSDSLVAFDINLGCSGFVYGLYMASMILSSMNDKKVLLCCGDVCSSVMNPLSPGKRAITGDAGSCVLLEPCPHEGARILFNINSYGEKFDALYAPNGGARNPYTMKNGEIDRDNPENFSMMDGLAILDFAMNEVCSNMSSLLKAGNINVSDIGAFLLHQPNYILIKSIKEKFELTDEQLIYNSQNIGNTSSASIPLLLTELGEEWGRRDNHLSLLSGFGIGLSVASVIMDLKETVCLKTLQYDSAFTFNHSSKGKEDLV